MPRGDDQDEGIRSDGAVIKDGIVRLLSDQAEGRAAFFDILQDEAAIADGGPDMHVGILGVKGGEQRGEEVLAGHGACRD